jgi:hypothetical protein
LIPPPASGLHVHTSRPLHDRGLRILQALMTAFDQRGFPVTPKSDGANEVMTPSLGVRKETEHKPREHDPIVFRLDGSVRYGWTGVGWNSRARRWQISCSRFTSTCNGGASWEPADLYWRGYSQAKGPRATPISPRSAARPPARRGPSSRPQPGQIDAVDDLRQLLDQANPHTEGILPLTP